MEGLTTLYYKWYNKIHSNGLLVDIRNGTMIYLILPVGSYHGWGVCGKYLTKELSRITDVKLITYDFNESAIADPIDYYFLKSKFAGQEESEKFKSGLKKLDYPTLQAINGPMLPWQVTDRGNFKVGYTFFEDNILQENYIKNAKDNFDLVITGSKWCEEVLKQYGLNNVETVIQGIDPQIFNPSNNEKKYFNDKFVIFSGGKFELRKGQDLVIKAYKILQDKYKDVMLITNWFNKWETSFSSMKASPFINFSANSNDYYVRMNQILSDNGIDTSRLINLPPTPNTAMARIYKNTDIGLFPNRCEGGTNLVLMEYMACGKPTIASFNTGHKDILTPKNSIMLNKMKTITINDGKRDITTWDEPDLDELVSNLEWAYNNRDKLTKIGNTAGKNMSQLTWEKSAKEFFKYFK